jgi:protein-tyrosine phosphatase
MARLAVADGITTIVTTPHQLGAHARNDAETIRQRTAALQQLLYENLVPLQVVPGADVRIEPGLIGKIRRGEVLTLADRGRYVLLELPHEVYLAIDGLVRDLDRAGLVGILSHPERNRGILAHPEVVKPLVDAGCLLQITAGSLTGTFGPEVQSLAESLVLRGLVHFVATDAHGARSRRPLLRRALDRVAELAGDEVARRICCHNPALVVTGQVVRRGRHRPTEQSTLGRWFRRRRAG